MPRKKRKIDDANQSILRISTVKCSLSAILNKNSPHLETFRNSLEYVLNYVNQLRVLACLTIKHHLLSCLHKDGSIPFNINQSYFSRIFTLLQKRQTRGKCGYLKSLEESVNLVRKCIPFNIPPSFEFSKRSTNQFLGYSARTLLAN
jgi:hypothetical protein